MVQLQASAQSIATMKALYTGPNADKTPVNDAGGLEAVVCLAKSARVMLTSNLWVDVGLVKGAMGTIKAICYRTGGPPDLPIAVMVHFHRTEGSPYLPIVVVVHFDNYSGPTFSDGIVPALIHSGNMQVSPSCKTVYFSPHPTSHFSSLHSSHYPRHFISAVKTLPPTHLLYTICPEQKNGMESNW